MYMQTVCAGNFIITIHVRVPSSVSLFFFFASACLGRDPAGRFPRASWRRFNAEYLESAIWNGN